MGRVEPSTSAHYDARLNFERVARDLTSDCVLKMTTPGGMLSDATPPATPQRTDTPPMSPVFIGAQPSPSLLPAFLAGFICCGALAAALWQPLMTPTLTELSSVREEAAVAQRALSQERLMHQQVDAAREATDSLRKDACQQEIAKAVAQVSCPDCPKCVECPAVEPCPRCPAPPLVPAESPPPPPAPRPPPPPAPLPEEAMDMPFGDCMAAARVLSDASGAAVKWTLEPSPRQGDTRRPSGADEVVLAYDGRVGNRTLVAADRLVHRLDDEAATPIAGWATAVRSMRRGEKAAFRFAQPAADLGGASAMAEMAEATFEIELLEVTPVENLSPAPSTLLLKTLLERGSGSETPSDGAHVTIDVEAAAANASSLSGLELVLGDSTGGDGLRRVVMSMTRNEVARVRMHPSLARPPLSASPGSDGLLTMTVRLVSFEQQKSLEHMSPTELIAHINRLKAAANARFASGDAETACAEYERAMRLLRLVAEADLPSEEDRTAWRGVQLSLRLNGAACALRAERHEQALAHSDAALSLAPNSTKALFRRGQALQGLGRLGEAEAAFVAVVEQEPKAKEAHTRLAEVRSALGRP